MKVPFTSEQFWTVFEKYNAAVFPMQLLLFLAGCAMLFLAYSKMEKWNKYAGYLLGFTWIWTGIAYHILFFSLINKAAYIFGLAFVVQGIMFISLAYHNKLLFRFEDNTTKRISCFFALFGLVVYPLIGLIIEKSIVHTITFGLPCPTTIFTFGLLGLQAGNIQKRFMVIPLAWSFIGLYAAFSMGVYQDVVMPVAGLYTFIITITRLRVA